MLQVLIPKEARVKWNSRVQSLNLFSNIEVTHSLIPVPLPALSQPSHTFFFPYIKSHLSLENCLSCLAVLPGGVWGTYLSTEPRRLFGPWLLGVAHPKYLEHSVLRRHAWGWRRRRRRDIVPLLPQFWSFLLCVLKKKVNKYPSLRVSFNTEHLLSYLEQAHNYLYQCVILASSLPRRSRNSCHSTQLPKFCDKFKKGSHLYTEVWWQNDFSCYQG